MTDYLKFIDEHRVVDSFMDLISINSPSYREEPIIDVLAGRLEALGFTVTRQPCRLSCNLIGRKKVAEGPSLILSAHMDTVEPTTGLSITRYNGIIKTTGDTVLGADDKSGIAQILEALTVIKEHNIPHPDLEVVLTCAEEKALLGAKGLDFATLASRHAIVMDSSGPVGKIVLAAPTHYTYVMTLTGKPAHAGIEPEKGTSSIVTAARIITSIPDGRIDSETTANVGIIAGGFATNIVPKETTIEGEVRGHNDAIVEKVKKTIFDIAAKTARKSMVKISISETHQYNSFKLGIDDPFVMMVAQALQASGITPEHVITGGGSDANVFNQHGIKAINLSTGMQKPHTTEEFINVDDLIKGSTILVNIIAAFANMNGSSQ